MNKDIFEGKWKQLRGLAKEQWGKLTDDELDKVDGRIERLSGLLQERYGYLRQEAEKAIESLHDQLVAQKPKKKSRDMAHRAPLLLAVLLSGLSFVVACAVNDAALTARVKAKLAVDTTVPASRINVDTTNKVVTLTGYAANEAEKARALELARHTSGVADVVDMIAVTTASGNADAPEPSRTLGTVIDDAAITAAVKSRLLDDPQVKGLAIDVDTRDGVVYLTGAVRSKVEQEQAVRLARGTKHVRDVQVALTIKNS